MPAPYNLLIKRSAERELRSLPKGNLSRVIRRIENLAQNPRPAACEKLFGEDGYRVRQGDYRILYTIDDVSRSVEVYKIGHRREVYR